jgi:tetratricopeptide (TPR) repeat protein
MNESHKVAHPGHMTSTSPKIGRNSPCPCGSRKKHKQCCGAAITRPVPDNARRHTEALSLAIELLQAHRYAEAAENCRQVLSKQPRHIGANYLMGYALLQSGDAIMAISFMELALTNGLRDAAAFYHYGTALAMTQRYQDAAFQFAQALVEKDDFEDARVNLANSYFELGAFPEAGEQYKRVIERNASNWKAYHNLAHVYYYRGDVDDAIQFFRKSVSNGPGYAEAHASLAAMLELNNEPADAAAAAHQALHLQPGNASAHVVLAKCLRRKKQWAEALCALDAIDAATATDRTYISIHNERGQNLDALGQYAAAYRAFAASKQVLVRLRSSTHDPLAEFLALDAAETYFTPRKIAELQGLIGPSVSDSQPVPVFVVGFHRSGTTLIEQILASHPHIGGGGELAALSHLEASRLGIGADLPAAFEVLLSKNDARPLLDLREAYLARLTAQENIVGKRWIVDKSLFNMLHLPLIHLLFPASPVIHVLRHPMDSVLSVFSQNFLWGNDWSLTMADTARAIERTWRHVEHLAPRIEGLRYMRISYENTVQEPDMNIRALLEFIGAAYDTACLKFHENRRVARTASYEQISRPIYSTSVERYRNYIPHIAPEVVDALRPVANSMGYAILDTPQTYT